MNPKLIAVSMANTSNLSTLRRRQFPWKHFRLELLFWTLILVSIPAFGFLLLRIVSRVNLS